MTGPMADLMAWVLAAFRTGVATYGLAFLRVGAIMALLPGFGERMIPARIRLVGAFAITAIVAPAVADRLPALPDGPASYLPLLLTETAVGLTLGFTLRLFIFALEIAGELAAQSGSLAQMFATGGDPAPALSHLLTFAAFGLMLTLGLHVRFVEVIILSYGAIPAGTLPGAGLLADWTIAHVAQAFTLAVGLAAPFVAIGLLYNLALGIVNRALPGLMLSFIGAPLLSGGALLLAAVALPFLMQHWAAAFEGFLTRPFAGVP
jgi:flagellar biosynthetic protein FliR